MKVFILEFFVSYSSFEQSKRIEGVFATEELALTRLDELYPIYMEEAEQMAADISSKITPYTLITS